MASYTGYVGNRPGPYNPWIKNNTLTGRIIAGIPGIGSIVHGQAQHARLRQYESRYGVKARNPNYILPTGDIGAGAVSFYFFSRSFYGNNRNSGYDYNGGYGGMYG